VDASQLVVGDEALHLALGEVAGGLVVVHLRAQQLQDGLAAVHLVLDQPQLAVDLHEALAMLVHELHDLLAGALLDALHTAQLPLQQQEVDLPLPLLARLAQRQQVCGEVQLLRLQLHSIHQL
jgi:hypothetical protein